MPVFKNSVAFKIARDIKVLLNMEASVARDGAPAHSSIWVRRLEQVGRRIMNKGRMLGARTWRLASGSEAGINSGNIVWIFGAGRTGSTWLASMMGELNGYSVWFEPWVGTLFDPYHLRLEDRKGKHFILSPRYKDTWLRSIRSFVLDGANARFPELTEDDYLVIKEPGGSTGAPLLVEALPESRVVLLVRDPRDVVASWMDGRRKGGWQYENKNQGKHNPETLADEDPDAFVRSRAKRYLQLVGAAKRAYDAHEGRKVLVKYEDLRADPLTAMRRLCSALEIAASEGELWRTVMKHSWNSISEEEKGKSKFYRKASPGGWREDLTLEQSQIVEKITAPLLNEFYPDPLLPYSPAERRHSKVGPARLWKMKRDFQIRFLKKAGLESQHRLLDLGCGTLRGGIPIIEYLEKGNYVGIEIRQEVLDEGRKELREADLVHKEPTLIAAPNISALNLEKEFDYIWAFSVLIHMEDEILRDAISLVRRHLKNDGSFYGNVNFGDRPDGSWQQGFPVIYRNLQFYEEVCSRNGLHVEDLGPLTDFGHHLPSKTVEEQAKQRMLRIWKA